MADGIGAAHGVKLAAMESRDTKRAEAEIAALRGRVWRLEETLKEHGIALWEEPEVAPAAMGAGGKTAEAGISAQLETPVAEETRKPVATETIAVPRFAPGRASGYARRAIAGEPHRLAVVQPRRHSCGADRLAWFLKLAIDNHWIGPLGRVLIGLVAGAALIAWSERFRSRGFAAFSYSLKAVGSGILYLSLWAAFSFFHLVPAGAAFAAMILVTAFNGYMAWAQDAELLALYAIVGGFSTPILISTGENHEVTLFSYLLLLDIAVLVLVLLRPWSRLLFAAFVGTVLMFTGWWVAYYSNAQSGRTAFFLAMLLPDVCLRSAAGAGEVRRRRPFLRLG